MASDGITPVEVPQIERNSWADNFFRPLLITIMIMCFNFALVNLVRMINPAWRGTYLLIGMLLTTVEAIYSYRVLKHLRSRGISVFRYRLAEGVVLIVVLKFLTWAGEPLAVVWGEIQSMWQNPDTLLDLEYYVLLTLGLIAWLAATNTIANFEELHDPYTFRSSNILPLDSLAHRFFWGGFLIVLISGVTQWISRAGLPSLIDFRRPSIGGVIFTVLIYFTLGLVLLSQARLSMLLTRWQIQKIGIDSDLTKQWAKYGLIFLGLVMAVVFFLPTHYTLGFLTSAGFVILFLMNLIVFLAELILLLLSLPLFWLFSLLGQSPESAQPGGFTPPTLPEPPPNAAPIPWVEAIRSLVFWLLGIAIVLYLIKAYLNDHPELVQGLRSFKPLMTLFTLLRELWQQLVGVVQAGAWLLPIKDKSSAGTEEAAPASWWSWFRPQGTSPRAQILYYYLKTLERAEKRGPARRASQTPYEYEPELGHAAPEAQSAVNLLTEAFVRARYSRGPFHKAQAALAKSLWEQIRQALRRSGKKPKEDEP